jgi:hypothetical protein
MNIELDDIELDDIEWDKKNLDWFKNILVSFLFSHYSKKLLLTKNIENETIKYLLNKQNFDLDINNDFINDVISEYANGNINLFNYIKQYGWEFEYFINFFMKLIKIDNYLIIENINTINYYSIDNLFFDINENGEPIINRYKKNNINPFLNYDKIPEYIILNYYSDNDTSLIPKLHEDTHFSDLDEPIETRINIDKYELDDGFNGIINIYNFQYRIDSIYIENYNKNYNEGFKYIITIIFINYHKYNGYYIYHNSKLTKIDIFNSNIIIYLDDDDNIILFKSDNIKDLNDIKEKYPCFSFNESKKTIIFIKEKKYVIIPQHNKPYYFNTFLMMFLYSQYSNHFLLQLDNDNKISENNDKFYRNIYDLIFYGISYNYDLEYFKSFISDIYNLLFDLHKLDKKYIDIYKSYELNKKYFIKYFLDKLSFNNSLFKYTILDFYENDLIFGFHENIEFTIKKSLIKKEKYLDISLKKKCDIEYYYAPHYLIINLWDDKSNSLINKYKKKCPKSLTIIKDKIIKFEDEIIYNGNTYKLDSCFLNIKDNDIENIAGITIENKKYIYNGWTQNYKKPVQKNTFFRKRGARIDIGDANNACGLEEYNWNIKDNKEFYIENCDIKEKTHGIKKSNLFSFNKGERILIYVLKEKIPDVIEQSKSSQSKSSQSKSSETKSSEIKLSETKSSEIKLSEIRIEGGKKTKLKKLKKYN